MKHLLILFNLVFLAIIGCHSQKIGYELRTNNKSYLTISHKIHDKGGLELRHKTDLGENRFTYRYKFKKFKLWAQQEFWFDQVYNLAIATDIPYKNYVYRVGWDTSNTIRFRISIKI